MRIFSSALRNIQLNKRINIEVSPLECTQEGQFSHGTRILETITNVSRIKDTNNFRLNTFVYCRERLMELLELSDLMQKVQEIISF